MTCLDCVERVEVRLWLPREAYDFFTRNAEWDEGDFQYSLLEVLRADIEAYFPEWRKAQEIMKLLEKLLRELNNS